MARFFRSRSSKWPFSFFNRETHSLAMLNTTQFLGVVNDNIFKLVMSFLLIDTLGKSMASPILSATGAVYVLPFLLFSSSAGILADRFSKQKLLIIMKIVEMVIMVLAFFAFSMVSVVGCYLLLFLLSTHSAMFGPSKYGIIPELVPSERVSRANGLVTAFTYLAMILGTFLASFLTDVTGRHFTWIIVVCFGIALVGFFSALCIKRTTPQGSQKKINLLFFKEIYSSLQFSKQIRHLLPAICGSAFFLFIGGFTQLNIIPFAMQCLNLTEVAGGYLFLVTAVGIAVGSYLAGKASQKRIELGLSCIAGLFICIFFLLMGVCTENLIKAVISLLFIGIFGGIFIVPFDTFIQLHSPPSQRGQMIAAGNFLSFFGVLIASTFVYVFPKLLHLSPAGGFAVMGVLTLLFTLMQMLLLSDLFLHFVSRIFLRRLFRFHPPEIEPLDKSILVLEKGTWKQALLLLGVMPNIHLIIPASHSRCMPWLHRLFFSIHVLPPDAKQDAPIACAQSLLNQGDIPCLFLEEALPKKHLPSSNAFFDFFQKKSGHFLFVHFEKDTVHFSEESRCN